MVIEKLHGLRSTRMSLNERFTLLASRGGPLFSKPRRRLSGVFFYGQFNNRTLIEQVGQRFGQNARRLAVRQRIGAPGLRRFGSEGSLAGLQRSNSFGNLNQSSVKKRISWRQSNGDLSRSASFNNLSRSVGRDRGFRRPGGRLGLVRGTIRGRGARGSRQQIVGRLNVQQGGKRVMRGQAARGGVRVMRGQAARGGVTGVMRGQAARGGVTGVVEGRGGVRGQGVMRGRGRGRGGTTRQPKVVPSKEELDLQLDQYMSNSKSALDKELEEYMKNAMDME